MFLPQYKPVDVPSILSTTFLISLDLKLFELSNAANSPPLYFDVVASIPPDSPLTAKFTIASMALTLSGVDSFVTSISIKSFIILFCRGVRFIFCPLSEKVSTPVSNWFCIIVL